MVKKKAVWKSPAAEAAARSSVDDMRKILCDFAKGRHPALKDLDKAFEILSKQLDRIETVDDPKIQLELLAWFLNSDALLSEVEEEDEFYDLFADACAFFTDIAKGFEDKAYLVDLVHDLAVNSTGEDGRAAVFLSLSEFLDVSMSHRLMESIFETVNANELENEDAILSAVRDMADGLGDPEFYEKASYQQDPDRSNTTLLDVANAYYTAGNIAETQRLLSEVKNPGLQDEEEFLDLSVACFHKLGKMEEAIKTAESLYEKFPKEFHLARLCQIVPVKRRDQLLDDHEKYRNSNTVNPNYIDLLISLDMFPRLTNYLNVYEKELAGIDVETMERFAERLETAGQRELAQKIKDWTVEEPETIDTGDE
jgi:hypothetical protein